jgi:hypothetical protein
MRSLLPFVLAAIISSGVSLANTANCPTSPTAISNAAIQTAPAGCTQVDLAFNLTSPVVSTGGDLTQSSSDPSDSSVTIQGTGVAGGTGATAQGLIFSQNAGFYGIDSSVSGYQGTGNETWAYIFDFAVSETAPNEELTGVFFALNNLVFTGSKISPLVLILGAGNDVHVEEISSSGTLDFAFPAPVFSSTVHVEMYTNYTGPSQFTLGSFEVGFDEASATPEPSSFLLTSIAAAGIAAIAARRPRRLAIERSTTL